MAVVKRSEKATTQNTGAERSIKATLGFLNIGVSTAQSGVVRIDAIRLLEGNEVHEQIFKGLNMQRPGDDKLTPEAYAAEKLKRLENFVAILSVTFNPSRTSEDNQLASF